VNSPVWIWDLKTQYIPTENISSAYIISYFVQLIELHFNQLNNSNLISETYLILLESNINLKKGAKKYYFGKRHLLKVALQKGNNPFFSVTRV
jgi:hypothetical protein